MSSPVTTSRGGERGIALVAAVLLLLALAGIAAAVTLVVAGSGSIARNQRWADSAAAEAEAGLELAKSILAEHARAAEGSMAAALPPARVDVTVSPGAPRGAARPADADACPDPNRPGCRDYERFLDQPTRAGNARTYIGRLLRNEAGQALVFDPRAPQRAWAPDLDGDGSPDLAGVTVWVRRPLVGGADAAEGDRVVVTAEGRYPPPARPEDPHAAVRLELALRVAPRPSSEEEGDSESGYGDVLDDWARVSGGSGPSGSP